MSNIKFDAIRRGLVRRGFISLERDLTDEEIEALLEEAEEWEASANFGAANE